MPRNPNSVSFEPSLRKIACHLPLHDGIAHNHLHLMENLQIVLDEARACRHCAAVLPLGPRPIFRISPHARILIASQAPGTKAHLSGVPFDDASGRRLREWLGVTRETFDDPANFAILPLGLCYPGRNSGGDAPPRRECAPIWRERLLRQATGVRLTLLVGSHSQSHVLGKGTMTDRVQDFASFLPHHLCLPHPSWRSTGWMRRNPWFERDVLPALRHEVAKLLGVATVPNPDALG